MHLPPCAATNSNRDDTATPRNAATMWMRRFARIAAPLLALYVTILLVLLFLEDRFAFPGWTFREPWIGPPPQTDLEEASISASDGNVIQGWWLPPSGWTPTDGAVLFMHGNGENLSTCGMVLKKWRDELKMGVLGFDYPGYGHSTGVPREESCYAAAQASLDWLAREKKVAPADVVLVGQSMGGAIATELAFRQRCRMLVTAGAFTSFPEIAQHDYFWFPARSLVHLRFDNLAKMGKLKTPVFIAHGMEDHTVPFSHGERLFAAAPNGEKKFFPVAGHGHSQPNSLEFYTAIREFMKESKSIQCATN